MPNWPASLPQFVLTQGYKRSPAANATPIDVESGEPMTRLRFTGDLSNVTASIQMDGATLAIFRNFWKYDLARGTLRFTYDDPATGEAVECLFAAPYEETNLGGDIYQIAMSLLMFA